MAVSWLQIGYWHDKISLWQRAVEATTDNAEAHYNLAVSLEAEGREAEALPHYAEALRIDPRDPRAHTNLGVALERRGRPEEARRHYEQALQAAPGYALAHFNLGTSLLRSGELKAAAAHLRAARAGHPNPAVVDYNLGRALAHQQQWEEAVVCFRQAVGLRPDSVRMHCSLAQALQHQGRSAEADAEYQEASRLEPDWPEASAAEAWFRATAPDAGRRNGLLALELAEQACQAAGGREPRYLDALAAAYAELGRFDQAVATADKAVGLAASGEQRQEMEDRLRLYKDRRPFRDARLAVPQPDGPVSGDSGR
jgi:Flp pilus assembly protein TadD